MKILVVCCLLFLGTLPAFSQQENFIYLQTENNQPFYIRLQNNVYSSTATGYLILSKLPEASLTITAGFPKSVFPEQEFSIPVIHKDAGFILKNSGDNRWSLANLQTQATIASSSSSAEKKKPEVSGIRKTDAFSQLLANAVNDTAIMYATVKVPKPVALPVATAKVPRDSGHAAVKPAIGRDSAVTVRQFPKKDSVSNLHKLPKPAANQHPARAVATTGTKKPAVTNLSKNGKERKDTIIIAGRPAPSLVKQKPAITKTNPGRKDTIIIMNDRVTKQPATPPALSQGTDSIVIKKEILQAPEEKRNALLNNKDAVVVEKVLLKRDSSGTSVVAPDTMLNSTNSAATPGDADLLPSMEQKRHPINKAAELLTDTSYIAVFVDQFNDRYDTIRISIPFNEASAFAVLNKPGSKMPAANAEKADLENRAGTPTPAPDTVKAIRPSSVNTSAATEKTDTAGIYTANSNSPRKPGAVTSGSAADSLRRMDSLQQTPGTNPAKNPYSLPATMADSTKKATEKLAIANSDCKEIASDADIDKLRVKMLVVLSDDERLGLAKKVFKQRCLLAKQVRALSELFKNDEGRYKWLDAAYPYVSDSSNFSALADTIKDEYYLNRFKAMLRH